MVLKKGPNKGWTSCLYCIYYCREEVDPSFLDDIYDREPVHWCAKRQMHIDWSLVARWNRGDYAILVEHEIYKDMPYRVPEDDNAEILETRVNEETGDIEFLDQDRKVVPVVLATTTCFTFNRCYDYKDELKWTLVEEARWCDNFQKGRRK